MCTGLAIINELKEANLLLFGNTAGEVKLHNIVRGMVLCITHDHSKTWHGAKSSEQTRRSSSVPVVAVIPHDRNLNGQW